MLWYMPEFSSFLRWNNIPLYVWTTYCLYQSANDQMTGLQGYRHEHDYKISFQTLALNSFK